MPCMGVCIVRSWGTLAIMYLNTMQGCRVIVVSAHMGIPQVMIMLREPSLSVVQGAALPLPDDSVLLQLVRGA